MTAEDPAAVTVDPPPGGCWVAVSCDLRISAVPPFRLGDAPPVVRRPSTLEVLGVARLDADNGGQAWSVHTIAFASGDAVLPVLAVELVDGTGRRVIVETPPRTIAVTGRQLPAGTALAGLERLSEGATTAWWSAVVVGSLLLGTAALLVSVYARRLAAAFTRVLAPLRVRRAATRLLRRAPDQRDVRPPYTGIVAAVRLAVGYRLGQSVAALTAAELAAVARRCDLSADENDRLAALLAKSDAVRFGGHLPGPDEIDADLGRARALVGSRRLVRRPSPGPQAR